MSHAYQEILHQPVAWTETIDDVPRQWAAIAEAVDPATVTHAVFMGSGTSLYIAQSAAHCFMEITGITASAIPTSEAFLSPASVIPAHGRVLAFVISRSGTTSEALMAVAHLREQWPHVITIGVTCNDGTQLEAAAHYCLALPIAHEESVVMTQSFTTLLLTLQIVAAQVANDTGLLAELAQLPVAFDQVLPGSEALAQEIGGASEGKTFIYLGLGPYQGLAEEGTLKLKEMTQSPCEAYNPLEFRHGPISIVDDATVVVLIEGEREAAYTGAVERDLQRHGAQLVALGPTASELAEHTVVIGPEFGDIARSVLYLPFAQLLGFYTAQAKGLDPDAPRNLNSVVVLSE
jgi:glucosamine--fructose-6-phosphate aminotransferase (isomerizing)